MLLTTQARCYETLIVMLSLAVLVPSGCSTGPRTTPRKLSSGRTIRVISVAPMTFKESGPALIFKYQTDLKVDQLQPLTQEVDEIWTDFKTEADKAGVSGVAISANEIPSGWPIYRNKGYTFIYVRQSDGSWQRQSSQAAVSDYVGRYTKPGNSTDYTDIKPDGTFVALDKGQTISGTYKVSGSTITLIVPRQGAAVGKLEPGKIIDNDGQTWVKAASQ